LVAAARSITHLGWGVDMVVANANLISEDDASRLFGERWRPLEAGSGLNLRVPVIGTLQSLMERHEAFLNRIKPDGRVEPVPSLSVFRAIVYCRATEVIQRSFAAFSLLRTNASGFRAFAADRQGRAVAGMMRHATKLVAKSAGWPDDFVDKHILGHGEPNGAEHVTVGPRRFAYIPLPTIEYRERASTVGAIRRVLLTAFGEGCESEIAWAQQVMIGQNLIDKKKNEAVALLSALSPMDGVVRRYTQPADTWATVTPVVLPGYDDPRHYRRRLNRATSSEEQRSLLEHLSARIDSLLRKAICQAGFTQELADRANVQWRKVGFWPGTEFADRYLVPDHLRRFPRFHVKIQWMDEQNNPIEIPGPICLGGGRFYGLGLFAKL
jgi:CRISPR-associated protein Csb2